MKMSVKSVENFSVGVMVLGLLMLVIFLAITVHGLVLAFSASILLGIVVLIVEPAPFIIGLVYWVGGIDLAQRLVEFFTS